MKHPRARLKSAFSGWTPRPDYKRGPGAPACKPACRKRAADVRGPQSDVRRRVTVLYFNNLTRLGESEAGPVTVLLPTHRGSRIQNSTKDLLIASPSRTYR